MNRKIQRDREEIAKKKRIDELNQQQAKIQRRKKALDKVREAERIEMQEIREKDTAARNRKLTYVTEA